MAETDSTTASETRRNLLRILLLLLMALGTVGVILLQRWLNSVAAPQIRASVSLRIYGQVPSFDLVECGGKSFSGARLNDKVWIADFIFTRCSGPCPMMSRQMAEIQKSLHGSADVRLVSFFVDPEFDTPKVLTQYAKRFEADPSRWFFLTGRFDVIQRLAKEGFKLSVEKTPPDQQATGNDPIIHSPYFVLVDRLGRIRGYYDSSTPGFPEPLIGDIKKLLKETRHDSGN